jgi:hypothetical protein
MIQHLFKTKLSINFVKNSSLYKRYKNIVFINTWNFYLIFYEHLILYKEKKYD